MTKISLKIAAIALTCAAVFTIPTFAQNQQPDMEVYYSPSPGYNPDHKPVPYDPVTISGVIYSDNPVTYIAFCIDESRDMCPLYATSLTDRGPDLGYKHSTLGTYVLHAESFPALWGGGQHKVRAFSSEGVYSTGAGERTIAFEIAPAPPPNPEFTDPCPSGSCPSNGGLVVSGASVAIAGIVSSTIPITKVELNIFDAQHYQAQFFQIPVTSPSASQPFIYKWSFQWDSRQVNDGIYGIEVRATDQRGTANDPASLILVTTKNGRHPIAWGAPSATSQKRHVELKVPDLKPYFIQSTGDLNHGPWEYVSPQAVTPVPTDKGNVIPVDVYVEPDGAKSQFFRAQQQQ